jgi:hypothetical protein
MSYQTLYEAESTRKPQGSGKNEQQQTQNSPISHCQSVNSLTATLDKILKHCIMSF